MPDEFIMIKKIIKLTIFFLIPIWVIFSNFGWLGKGKEKINIVRENKGQEGENDFIDLNKYNLFPIDRAVASGVVPTRSKDYYDQKIWAGSSVAIDVDSGTILYYDNGRKKTQIASLTKLMTAILAVENIQNLETNIVTIPREASLLPGTVVGCPTSGVCPSNRLYTGEKVKAINLLRVMLMNSANDAAYSLAYNISGNEEKFVKEMNEKAKSLGLKDTHFCTASGLEIDGQEDQCYSSAYDIARIGAYSLKYDLIWEIMRIPDGKFYSADGTYMHELVNTDILVGEDSKFIGGKTGFTPMAGKSLLAAAKDPEGHRIVAVLLDDEKRWEDMRTLVNWAFEAYEWK